MASNQYTPNGGKNSGQGWQYNPNQSGGGSNRSSGSPSPRKNGWGEWIAIAILFFIPSGFTQLISIIWAIVKVVNMSKAQKQKIGQEVRRAADHIKRDVESAVRDTKTYSQSSANTAHTAYSSQRSTDASYSAPKASPAAPPKRARKPKGGKGLIVSGSIIAGIFGFSSLAVLFDSLSYGFLYPDDFSGILVCALLCAAGLVMLGCGIGKNRRKERFHNYLGYIGANREVDLAHMAAAFGVPVQKLCRDLRRMLSDGILPTGYLDLAAGKLFLTEMGYQAPAPEAQPEPEPTMDDDDAILREIRQVNDDIPDEVMSAKIDRIEEITGKILAYQKAHPNRSAQLRSFLNYYLPTTLKILRAYAQLDAQGIEGENISAAKARIEGMMDQVVAGFEKQLDKLFQDDAMDISSDVQVLENMLKKDGLSGDGQTMTL